MVSCLVTLKTWHTLQQPANRKEGQVGSGGREGQQRTQGEETGISEATLGSGKGKLAGLVYCPSTSQSLGLSLFQLFPKPA